MSKSYIQKGEFATLLARRSWIIIVMTVIVMLLMPHTNVPQFDYELDHPWKYDQLIAKSETPLYKSEEVLKRERDSLMGSFEPYYNYTVTVREQALKSFRSKYSGGIQGLSANYASYIAKRIRQAYDKGIVSAEKMQEARKDSTIRIRMVSGNTATSVLVKDLLTPMTAYEWFFSDPLIAAQRTALQHCNINTYFEPNIIYDATRSEMELDDLMSSIPVASGMIQVGEKIIDRGEVVNEKSYQAITAYFRDMQQRTTSRSELLTTYGGQTLYVFIIVLLYTMYLLLYRHDYFDKVRSYAMLYSLMILMPAIVSLTIRNHFFTVYVLPLCMAPMFVRIFMDSRTAFITHACTILLCALAVQGQFEFVIIELVGGLVAIYTLRELSHRSQVFIAAFTITLTQVLAYASLELIQASDIHDFNVRTLYHFAFNGVLLLLSYPLMYLVEKAFGFVSAVTLFELSDTNKGLLRRLSEVAPATMQHSMTVGNLASEIASKIGAKALLVRVGALYHDIGKMRHPVFFTENQAGINPHNRISETDSAQVVISHVTEGLRLAEKENLPDSILDFIRTHHGAGMTRYFYVQYKNNHPDEDVDEALFTYPGPNPFTREQAILMMADTAEAATRSLTEYTEESISALVNRLIDSQVQQGFFTECPITFRDIKIAKDVLIERLKVIYHTRIAYPELKTDKKDSEASQQDEPVDKKEDSKEKEQKEQK